MQIDIACAGLLEINQALVSIVTPRPIAWVSTIDKLGRPNLAPFSFFNVFSSNPPIVVFSPVLRRDATKKDTLLNLEEVPEFVVHAAVWSLAEELNLTCKELPRYESEADLAGLELIPSVKVKPPRVKRSPVQMEARVRQIIPLGDGPMSGNLVLGEIIYIHVDDAVLDDQGKIDPRKLQTIARLGGDWYCRTSDLFEMKRPT